MSKASEQKHLEELKGSIARIRKSNPTLADAYSKSHAELSALADEDPGRYSDEIRSRAANAGRAAEHYGS